VIRSHVETLLEEGGRYDLELEIVTDEGARRHVRTIGAAHRSGGETTRIDGVIQDITKQKKQEKRGSVASEIC